MREPDSLYPWRLAAVILTGVLGACTVVGPAAISSGRLAYNEAITETNNQQMLMVLVHNRYEENNNLLAVSSVTANVSVKSSAAIQAGIGSSDNYSGNLVPFAGGFIYEENPTISYTPVTGEAYLRQLTAPIPLTLFVKVSHTLPYPDFAYSMMLSSVNGIRNPSFLYGDAQDDPRFDRFVSLMTELDQRHALHWPVSPDESMTMVIEPITTRDRAATDELLDLLKLPSPVANAQRITVPVFMALHGEEASGIGMATRSLWELVEILTAAVEVPAGDLEDGTVSAYPRAGRPGRNLAINYSLDRPERPYIAVEHRDGWFYIDERDAATKRYFKLFGSLWSAAMAESLGSGSSTPVLTVPVSR